MKRSAAALVLALIALITLSCTEDLLAPRAARPASSGVHALTSSTSSDLTTLPVFLELYGGYAIGIDAEGTVYGASDTISGEPHEQGYNVVRRTARWPATGGIQPLGADLPRGLWSYPQSISPNGQWMVGYRYDEDESPFDVSRHSWIWRSDGAEWRPPSGLAYGGGVAYGVNDGGTVVGWVAVDWTDHYTDEFGEESSAAFVWTASGGTRILPRRVSSTHCFARDINDAGMIVGGCGTYPDFQAMVWTASGDEYTDVGALIGAPCSYLTHVNKAGEAVGTFCEVDYYAPFRPSRPFRWSASAGLRPLPLPVGVSRAVVNDINSWGDLVGSVFVDGQERGVVWVGGTDQILLLPDQIIRPSAINDAGQVAAHVSVPPSSPFTSQPSFACRPCDRVVRIPSGIVRGGEPLANQAPTADAGGPYEGVTQAVISFDARGSSDPDGEALTYWWDFGDGKGSTSATPSHQYLDAGTYTVTLEVRDTHSAAGRATITVPITQAPGSPVAVVSGPYTGSEGVAVTFSAAGSTDPEGGPLTYAWDFGDGDTGSDPAASHVFADDGTYTVSLRVTDRDGLSSSRAWTVATIVNSPPVVSTWIKLTTTAGPDPFVVGRGQLIEVRTTFGDPGHDSHFTVRLDWGDGRVEVVERRVEGPPFDHGWFYWTNSYSAAGTYPITVSVRDEDGATGGSSELVTVLDDLAPVADAGPRYTAYEGTPLQLDGSASRDPEGGPLTYDWDLPGAARLTGATPTYAFPDQKDGSYAITNAVVSLIVTDQRGLISRDNSNVDVLNVAPTVTLTSSTPSPSAGTSFSLDVTFRDPGVLDSPWDYSIDWGDGSSSTTGKVLSAALLDGAAHGAVSVGHTYTGGGTFIIKATVRDKDMGSGLAQLTVTVSGGDRAPVVNGGGPYAGTEATSLTFSSAGSSDPEGGALTYLWSFGDGTTSSSANPSKKYADNGTYTVRLTVKDPTGLTSTATTTATIANAAPTASFSAPSSVYEAKTYVVKLSSATDVSSVDKAAGFKYAFDCGAGNGYSEWGTITSVTCAARPDNVPSPLTVRAKLRDKDGGEREYTKAMTVSNVAPVVTPLVLVSPTGVGTGTSADPIRIRSGDALSVTSSFTDVGLLDAPWAIKWVWGDGLSTATTTSTQGQVPGESHTFLKTGALRAYLQVTDKDAKYGKSGYLYVTVDPLLVGLDVLPNANPKVIDLDAVEQTTVAVAVLSADGLDATKLSTSSLRFGNGSGSEASITGTPIQRDVNGDGRMDLVASFKRSSLVSNGDLTTATTQLVLVATHADGRKITGTDAVQVVP